MADETRILALGRTVVLRTRLGAEPAAMTLTPEQARQWAASLLLAAERADGGVTSDEDDEQEVLPA